MRKHRILAGILAVALVLSLGGVNISAATGSPMTKLLYFAPRAERASTA